ncbi:hypothetical protein Ac2012v2_000765 [Leucoagaricus gongylophorus]
MNDLFSSAEADHLLDFLDSFWLDEATDHPPYPNPDSAPPSTSKRSTRPPPRRPPPRPRLTIDSDDPTPRQKSLLSTPQKRLNHIMSEQKRRNAIRDGYAQLISLLASGDSIPALPMPTRGRPKGSGSRAKGQTRGKSGVLFRAVEYCHWLEQGRDALLQEVLRLEAAVDNPC